MRPELWIIQASGLLIMSMLLNAALTQAARRLAPRLGFVDRPDGVRKLHRHPTPLLGGVALLCSVMLSLAVSLQLAPHWLIRNAPGSETLSDLLISACLLCALGVLDDWKALRPRTKFACQLLALGPYVLSGAAPQTLELLEVQVAIPGGGQLLTLLWLAACINAFNLIDGLDGLAGAVSLMATGGAIAVGLNSGNWMIVTVGLVTAGSLLGFLVHNLPPARIFLGDSGSLTVGFLVGVLTLEAGRAADGSFDPLWPLLLVGVPVIDTAAAIIRRRLAGRGIGEADRQHLHHRLQQRGLSNWQTLSLLSSVSMGLALAGVATALTGEDWIGLSTLALSVVGLLATGVLVGPNLRATSGTDAARAMTVTRGSGTELEDSPIPEGSPALLRVLQIEDLAAAEPLPASVSHTLSFVVAEIPSPADLPRAA